MHKQQKLELHMKIQAANGYYIPSYFFMKIESTEDIEKCIENN